MIKAFLPKSQFERFFQAIIESGYSVIGPQVKDAGIVFEPLQHVDDLPWGVEETVEPGSYRLENSNTERCFSWNTGPQGIKPWLFKPEQTVWHAEPTDTGFRFIQSDTQASPLAILGLRACDLAALCIQDKHFLHGAFPDPWYKSQREQLLLIAVNCSRSNDNCFCVSTGDGPEASYGFDLALDELDDGFLIQAKSDKGNNIIEMLSLEEASTEQTELAKSQLVNAINQQHKELPTADKLRELLNHLDDQQWLAIAERCLACGNCTSVCPTCFCSKQETSTDISSKHIQQTRLWDSCFTEQHGYIAGKQIRNEISQRYRQWMVHKLVTWQDQYGRSGCVGCGRCISWCPVGIDLVKEVQDMLEQENE